MAKLILKCPYIKGGGKKNSKHLSNMVKYIGTRDGVELLPSGSELCKETVKQHDFIQELLKEFPEAKDSYEFDDYLSEQNQRNASNFISYALEENAHKLVDSVKYLDYIANRPRVEKHGKHGLFSYYGSEDLVLKEVMEELSVHEGNIWLPIVSLRREDAQRTGFDSAETWKALINEKIVEIAENFKIRPENLRWYGAFHNEGHHPHVHLMIYSFDPKEGYLTKDGIKKMKSTFATAIFQQDLLPLYEIKTQNRDELKAKARETMEDLIEQMKSGLEIEPRTEELIEFLSCQLKTSKGKKQYGYLPPKVKNVVDEIVNQLGKLPVVEEAYELWWQTQEEIFLTYSDETREKPPLSHCKDFKSIKNMIIQEVMQYESIKSTQEIKNSLEEMDFDYENSREILDEINIEVEVPEESEKKQRSKSKYWEKSEKNWWNKKYKEAKKFLHGDEKEMIPQDFEKAFDLFLEQEKNPLAQLELGKMYEKGLGCEVNLEKARECEKEAFSLFFERETEKPWQYTQYRIGKMLASGIGTKENYEKAVEWLTKAYESDPEKPHIYAAYTLAGLYKNGLGVEVDKEKAFVLYKEAATEDFPFASFEVAKCYETGVGTEIDLEKSQDYYKTALEGFVKLEKSGNDDKLQYRLGKMYLEGKGIEVDLEKAKEYFLKSARVGNQFACYQLAKILLADDNPNVNMLKTVVDYLEIAAEQGNEMAQYQLGKILMVKENPFFDVKKAVEWLEKSAQQGNQHAQYTLGKLYFWGNHISADKEKAWDYFQKSVEQGNKNALFYVENFHALGNPPVSVMIGKILHHLGEIFESNQPSIPKIGGLRIDRKRFLKLSEKKEAQGHKRDDFAQQSQY